MIFQTVQLVAFDNERKSSFLLFDEKSSGKLSHPPIFSPNQVLSCISSQAITQHLSSWRAFLYTGHLLREADNRTQLKMV